MGTDLPKGWRQRIHDALHERQIVDCLQDLGSGLASDSWWAEYQLPGRQTAGGVRGELGRRHAIRDHSTLTIEPKNGDHAVEYGMDSLAQGFMGIFAKAKQIEIDLCFQPIHAADPSPEDNLDVRFLGFDCFDIEADDDTADPCRDTIVTNRGCNPVEVRWRASRSRAVAA